MAQLEHIEAIEKRLWTAADTLRANSNYASNEYFLPVMGLVFLRHAYSRFLGVKDAIEAGLPTRGGKTRPLTKEDFSQKSAIFLQPKAQFDTLVALPDSADRAKAIIDAMESIEADYENGDGLTIELEVELDDGRVDVDFDVDDFVGPFPAGFSLTEFAGLELPIYPDADVVDVEWDFNFDHPGTDTEAVFDYYDQHLQDLGWTQTELDDGDDDEWEAEYVNEGVHLELEVEDDSEVEIEVNKLRFY